MPGRVIAILGAESTGKTELAQALAAALQARTGRSATWVPEWLRAWCEREGRTPRSDEQAAIAAEQQSRIEAAAAKHDFVVADTTAAMTAVYSALLFDDRSLHGQAQAWQRAMAATLVTATDLPWIADGLQRDGPQVREPVDRLLLELLHEAAIPWHRVAGTGPARLESAWAALAIYGLVPQRC